MATKIYPLDTTLFCEYPMIARMCSVADRHLTAPPGSPAEGDRYIVASVATGAWAGKENQIAEYHQRSYAPYSDATPEWYFYDPQNGFPVYVTDEDEFYFYALATTSWRTVTSALTGGTNYYEKHTVTAGEAGTGIIDLTGGNTYVTGDNSMWVYQNGMLDCITADYAETSTSRLTFVAGRLSEGDDLILRWTK